MSRTIVDLENPCPRHGREMNLDFATLYERAGVAARESGPLRKPAKFLPKIQTCIHSSWNSDHPDWCFEIEAEIAPTYCESCGLYGSPTEGGEAA